MPETDNHQTAAFDYKSSSTQEGNLIVETNSMNTTQNQNPNTAARGYSYSSAARSVPKPAHPKKDQAIVLHAEESLKLFDYVKAVGDIVGPKNIAFASRISNNRICMYLTTKEVVEDLIRSHPKIPVGHLELNVRRLISPTKRILISNINPDIPHELVEDTLKGLGLHLASPVSYLRAGMPSDVYSHILSFRRQVYVFSRTEDFELQTSVVIPFDENTCRIFLSTDRMECFVCKQTGHIANSCPNPPAAKPTPQQSSPVSPPAVASTASEITASQQGDSSPALAYAQKRSLSDTGTPSDHPSQPSGDLQIDTMMPPPSQTTSSQKVSKPAKKKCKRSEAVLSETTKLAIEKVYQKDSEKFILPLDRFLAFLENTYDNSEPYLEALKFTKDVRSLLSNMHTVYPALSERSLKNRFTRLTKKIKDQLILEQIELGSISSIVSHGAQETSDDDLYSDGSQLSQRSSY